MLSGSFSDVTYTGRIKHYPDGSREILVCTKPIFRYEGWEERTDPKCRKVGKGQGDNGRAIRRAKAAVRDIALCNEMSYFVTLTLDKDRVDRYDVAEVTKKLNAWLSNQVQRKGLKYVLVPELHKDGAVHYHGLFNAALEVTDSGTIIPPEGGKPRRPRSKAQAAEWLAAGGKVVHNLPGWPYGFTTAIRLYGEYDRAISYVCKYIGKDLTERGARGKIGGRWYYSGGQLAAPRVTYEDLEWRDWLDREGAYFFRIPDAGAAFLLVREAPFDIFRSVKRDTGCFGW